MAAIPDVQLFVYPSVVHINSLNPAQILQQAQSISINLSGLPNQFSYQVNPPLLEHCNMRYSEKQVTRIDENFQSYSLGTRFRLNLPNPTPPGRLRYLINKFFSGDVSSDIGEALFAYFLIHIMSVQPHEIGHTRPAKRTGELTPDFVIDDNAKCLSSILPKNYALPLLAEVKSFTGPVDPNRISHALAQLQMGLCNSSLTGLLFLVIRNEDRQGYDTYLVEVEN
jgi:hypothetical protein